MTGGVERAIELARDAAGGIPERRYLTARAARLATTVSSVDEHVDPSPL